jgi:hypothetical protein
MERLEIGRHKVTARDLPNERAGINGRLNALSGKAQAKARELGKAYVVITVEYEAKKD